MSLIELEDGSYQIVKTNKEGVKFFMEVDEEDIIETRRGNISTKAYKDDDGLIYSTDKDLEDERIIKEVKTHVIKVREDEEIRELKERIKELEKEGIQKRKDKASLEDHREGGGVVRYGDPDMRKKTSIHDDKRTVIYELYDEARKGSKDAKNKLDQLWKLTIPRFKEIEKNRTSIVIVECPNPNCTAGIDPEIGDCPVCGWNKDEKGYSKIFDEIVEGRKV